jgi:transglutaminase-like putative cysteine protease
MTFRLQNWKTPALLLVLLAITGFCVANGRGPLLLLSWGLAIGGWWFSERKDGQYLPRWAVLSLVLGVLLWAFYRASPPQQIDVTLFCEFLTLVLIIKTWDRKLARDISQLIAMSVFLIIGAILDNNSLAVGAVVLICMPLTAWAVMAMQIGTGYERAAALSAIARRSAADTLSQVPNTRRVASPPARRLSTSVTQRLIPVTTFVTLLGVIFAITIFLFIPRGLASAQWGSFGAPSRTMRTGFTDEVELGRAGLLTESQRTVLEARFSDETDTTIGGDGEVFYLRGAVLGQYVRGRWTGQNPEPARIPIDPQRDRTVRQQIDLREELGKSSQGRPLFALWYNRVLLIESRGYGNNQQTNVPSDPGRVWYRNPEDRGTIRYTVTSVIPGIPSNVTERTQGVKFDSKVVHDYALNVLSTADVDPDPATRPPEQDATVARILTGHLRGKFEYTTEIGSPTQQQDPIEWFLTEAKRGHCEYFASALTALCRSVGVNARVIAGYIAAEFSADTGRYTVRESNAHAWTEVEVSKGVWVTFDPTPPVALMNVHERQPSWTTRMARFFDFVNDTWTNSVVMFDNQQQRQVFDMSRVRISWLDNLSRRAARDYQASGGRSVFKYIFAIAAVLGAAVVLSIAAIRALSGVGKIVRKLPGSTKIEDPVLRQLLESATFYSDSLGVLEKAGYGKPIVVPPATHARALARHNPQAAAAFRELTELYYTVRFGHKQISQLDTARADALVKTLEDALSAKAATTSSPSQNAGAGVTAS